MATFRRTGLLLFWLVVTCWVQAQSRLYLQYQRFTEKEGYHVLEEPGAITQDKKGLLWLGSDNGLFSFDGTHFRNYRHRPDDSTSLPANWVTFAYQDRAENYWVGVPGHGLFSLDEATQQFKKFHYRNENDFNIHQQRIGVPTETNSGDLWFPLLYFGLAKWSAKTKTMQSYKLCDSAGCEYQGGISWVYHVLEDPDDGNLWLATNDGLVQFFPATGRYQVFKDRAAGNVYTRLYFDAQNRLWTGTWGSGIKQFDRMAKRFTTYKWAAVTAGTKNICPGIGRYDDQRLWVASFDNGLLVFDPRDGCFQQVSNADDDPLSLSGNTFFQNRTGAVWLASQEQLVRLHAGEQKFRYHSLESVLNKTPTAHLLNTFVKTDSLVLTGVYYEGYLIAIDPVRQTAAPLYPEKVSRVHCLAKDQNGLVWIGAHNGVYTFNPATKRLSLAGGKESSRVLNTLRVYDILHDIDGSVWLAAHQGLVHYRPRADTVEWIYRQPQPNPAITERILTVYKDKKGRVWFGSNALGLGSYDPSTRRVMFFDRERSKSYPQENCESISETADGRILFASGSTGLCVLEHPFTPREKLTICNSANGLPADKVYSIFHDRQQACWLLTAAGLCLFDETTLSVVRRFTREEGLRENVLYSRPYQDEEGKMYLGFRTGYQEFDPSTVLRTQKEEGAIYLSSLTVNGREWKGDLSRLKMLSLPHDSTNLYVRFAFLTPSQAPGYSFTCRLAGVDKSWKETGPDASVQYSNLAPGSYTLHLKALNQDGTMAGSEFLLPLVISPPWYGSGWFYSLLAVLVIAITVSLFRYRIAQIKKENRLKNAFNKKISEMEMRALRAQMNPHFIFNCLNSINRYIVKSDHKTASGYLTKFAKLIRLILDNSASDTITLDREIQTLQLYIDMERLRFDHAFTYEIDTGNIEAPETITLPSMLLQPYVENAIWHGLLHKPEGTGKLCLRFRLVSHSLLRVEIEDNGIGRKKAKELSSRETVPKKSYGLQISRERIQLMNELYNLGARVEIADLQERNGTAGTKVTVDIPLSPNEAQEVMKQ